MNFIANRLLNYGKYCQSAMQRLEVGAEIDFTYTHLKGCFIIPVNCRNISVNFQKLFSYSYKYSYLPLFRYIRRAIIDSNVARRIVNHVRVIDVMLALLYIV